jgi:hypothetical protein
MPVRVAPPGNCALTVTPVPAGSCDQMILSMGLTDLDLGQSDGLAGSLIARRTRQKPDGVSQWARQAPPVTPWRKVIQSTCHLL